MSTTGSSPANFTGLVATGRNKNSSTATKTTINKTPTIIKIFFILFVFVIKHLNLQCICKQKRT
ncbi:hypothetical protein [Moraxella lacunata]|uniref:hypothetical protein n=1 Tax=Moraxella lacunata TaxID=477 RepID=UPI003EDEFA87